MLAEVAAATQDYISSPSVLADQITAAGLTSWLIQLMKKSDWWVFRWIDDHSTTVTRSLSAFVALATTAGFQLKWEGTLAAGGDLHIHIPVASAWLSFIWRSGGSLTMQQLIYQGVIKHEAGQTAADIVAEKVIANKDELAEAVVQEADPHELQKLAEQSRVAEILEEHRTKPEEVIDWDWGKKP